eukprot:jgi/Mesvir1/15815/Mv03371-RA.1
MPTTSTMTNSIIIHSTPVRRPAKKGKVAETRGFRDAMLMSAIMANAKPVAYPPLSALTKNLKRPLQVLKRKSRGLAGESGKVLIHGKNEITSEVIVENEGVRSGVQDVDAEDRENRTRGGLHDPIWDIPAGLLEDYHDVGLTLLTIPYEQTHINSNNNTFEVTMAGRRTGLAAVGSWTTIENRQNIETTLLTIDSSFTVQPPMIGPIVAGLSVSGKFATMFFGVVQGPKGGVCQCLLMRARALKGGLLWVFEPIAGLRFPALAEFFLGPDDFDHGGSPSYPHSRTNAAILSWTFGAILARVRSLYFGSVVADPEISSSCSTSYFGFFPRAGSRGVRRSLGDLLGGQQSFYPELVFASPPARADQSLPLEFEFLLKDLALVISASRSSWRFLARSSFLFCGTAASCP